MADDFSSGYHLSDYVYELPEELVAQFPCGRREDSRLLVLNRRTGRLTDSRFERIIEHLFPGDLLVLNDTQVVRARLQGKKQSGGKTELLVIDPYKDPEQGRTDGYWCLIKSSKPSRPGTEINLNNGVTAEVLGPVIDGKALLRFNGCENILDYLEQSGEVPLPPYIKRDASLVFPGDPISYQTVYARSPGAVAAPTAGLHISEVLLDRLSKEGIKTVAITLHVGYGTFAPVREPDIRNHKMHSEFVEVPEEAAAAVSAAVAEGRRVIAVGTTVVRSLEWVAGLSAGQVVPWQGLCDHYIYPGYPFRVVNAMITNFHLPMSSLLLLVSAFAGRERILEAYLHAITERFRFFSYGDAMFIE